MRYILFLIALLLLAAPGCGRFPAIPESKKDTEDVEDMNRDVDLILTLDAEELARMIRGDDWELRLAAGSALPEREDIPLPQRVEFLMQGLEQEIKSPARGPLTMGIYLPPSDYVRLHLTRELSKLGPEAVPALRQAAASASAGARSHALIALVYLGDGDAASQVRELLAHSPCPWVRMDAAGALGEMGDREAIALLTAALQDSFSVTEEKCTGSFTIFPVREQAAGALEALGVEVELLGDSTYQVRR